MEVWFNDGGLIRIGILLLDKAEQFVEWQQKINQSVSWESRTVTRYSQILKKLTRAKESRWNCWLPVWRHSTRSVTAGVKQPKNVRRRSLSWAFRQDLSYCQHQVNNDTTITATKNPDIMSWSISANPTSQNFESQQWMTLSMRNSVQTIELLHHWPLNSSEICCFQAWLAKMESSAECFLESKLCWEKENTTGNKKK